MSATHSEVEATHGGKAAAFTRAMCALQAAVPLALKRDASNDTAGYRYMTLDALIAATRPLLNEHGFTLTQWPTMVERGTEGMLPALTTNLNHIDGGRWSDTMPLYLTDKTMQGLGTAITYARRYAWASVLGIAAEEDTDAAPMSQEDIPF